MIASSSTLRVHERLWTMKSGYIHGPMTTSPLPPHILSSQTGLLYAISLLGSAAVASPCVSRVVAPGVPSRSARSHALRKLLCLIGMAWYSYTRRLLCSAAFDRDADRSRKPRTLLPPRKQRKEVFSRLDLGLLYCGYAPISSTNSRNVTRPKASPP